MSKPDSIVLESIDNSCEKGLANLTFAGCLNGQSFSVVVTIIVASPDHDLEDQIQDALKAA